MRRDLSPRYRGSRCHLHAPVTPLHIITNNHKHAGLTINEKNGGPCPSPPLLPSSCGAAAAHAAVLRAASSHLCQQSGTTALGRQPLRASSPTSCGHLVRRLAHGRCARRRQPLRVGAVL
ncbi:hypothetical protein BHM03_00030624 [Ensete ventricosum]|nr:hypothetical protein BHM03_00030624 [Ensete ventricosum]